VTSADAGAVGAGERGTMLVLFAILLPLFLGVGSIVISVGNCMSTSGTCRHRWTSAAFAAGTQFTGCFAGSAAANVAIRSEALAFAGDVNRAAATTNVQVQEPGDVHVVLNSARYWRSGDPVDDAGFKRHAR